MLWGGWWWVYLDYNVSSGPSLSFEIEIGDAPGPKLDNILIIVGLPFVCTLNPCLDLVLLISIYTIIIYHLYTFKQQT